MFCDDNTVNLFGASNAFPAFDHIEKHPIWIPVERIAITTTAAVMSPNFLPRFDDERGHIRLFALGPIAIDQVGRARNPVVSSVHATGGSELTIARDHDCERIAYRTIDNFLARRATGSAGSATFRKHPDGKDMNWQLNLIDLDAIAVHEARNNGDAVIDPAICLRTCRSAIGGQHHPVDEWRISTSKILPGNNRHTGSEARATFRHAKTVA